MARLLNDHEKTRYSTDRIMAADPCPRKPESVALQALVDRYQLDPARCLVVGDRDSDVLVGVRAGVKTCFYGDDARGTPVDLEVTGLDRLLLDWLKVERRRVDAVPSQITADYAVGLANSRQVCFLSYKWLACVCAQKETQWTM